MSSILDASALEQIFQGNDHDTIIARPGEPVVNIDAREARRRVTAYLGREVSMMMGGTEPALIFSNNRLVWRVPVIFTSPFKGQLGVVGAIDVDTRTQELLIDDQLEETLRINAHALANHPSHSSEA